MGRGERIRFVGDYLTRLYERQGERRRPLLQIIDEAARFCPQVIPHGAVDVARCSGAMETMVEEGRNVGTGVALITQRSARMNKSVSELAECMVAFRTIGPNSVAAILDWFGEHVEKARWKVLVEQLRRLPRGQALVVSPEWLEFEGVARIRQRWTFDSSATPVGGRERRAAGPGAKPDLGKYRARMAETIERAKAEDPRELRRQVVELKAQLAKAKPSPAPVLAAKQKRVEIEVVKPATVKAMERALDRADGSIARAGNLEVRLREAMQAAGARGDELRKVRDDLVGELRALRVGRSMPAPSPRLALIRQQQAGAEPTRILAKPTAIMASRQVEPGDTLAGSERKLLTVLAQHGGTRTVRQLALQGGYAVDGGGFRNPLGRLRSRGFVKPGDPVIVTDSGLAALGPYEALPTGRALLDWWLRQLGGPERNILSAVAAVYPRTIGVEDLARETGYEPDGGGFRNPLGRLRTLQLVSGRGKVRAAEELFG